MITHRRSVSTRPILFILTSILAAGLAHADTLTALDGRTLVVQKKIAFNGKDLAVTLPGSQCQIVFKAAIKAQPTQMIEPGTAIELRSTSTPRRLRAMMVPDVLDYLTCPADRAPASAQETNEDAFQKDFGETFKVVGSALSVEKS